MKADFEKQSKTIADSNGTTGICFGMSLMANGILFFNVML